MRRTDPEENHKRKVLRRCKRLHDISRSRPQDEEARKDWMDFANKHIFREGLLDVGDTGIATSRSPRLAQFLRKMLIDEGDVEAVRRMFKQDAKLLDLTSYFGSCLYTIFELALVFDLSIEIIRVIRALLTET